MLQILASGVCWGLVLVTWIAGAARSSRRARSARQPGGSGALWRLAALLGALLVFHFLRHDLRGLATRSSWVEGAGLALLLAATAFTLWARFALGAMWSISPDVLKPDHELRTSGPYAVVRHPIYSGLTGMLVGSALLNGLGGWVVLILVGVALCATRVPIEERLMSKTFPGEYERYRKRVPQLIPGLYLLRRALQGGQAR